MASEEKFEEQQFMRDLVNLKDTQEAIQSFSGWCIRQRKVAYKIARCWLKVVKKVKVEQKLTLFYLINDIVQHSKRKSYTDLLDKFQGVLKESMPHLKDEKIVQKIHRVLNIWSERQIFPEKCVTELMTVIESGLNKEDQEIVDNFQPQQLCTQIKIMKALEDDTDYKLKTLKENDLNLNDIEALRQNLKDRQHGNDFINDFEEGRKRMEQYVKALDREITKRRQVIDLLTNGTKYYDSLLGEANIVANAYTNFGKRVKNLKRKLQEKLPELEKNSHTDPPPLDDDDLSPIPSPDYDAPSPVGEELELELPEDETPPPVATQAAAEPPSGDLTSRLDSLMGSQKTDNFSISEFLTKLASGESVAGATTTSKDAFPPAKQAPPPPPIADHYVPGLDHISQSPHYVPGLLDPNVLDTSGASSISSAHPSVTSDPPPSTTNWWATQTSWASSQPAAPTTDWQEQEPVPEWQIPAEDEEPLDDGGPMDDFIPNNLALARLRQAAKKGGSSGPAVNDSTNLISLTGSPKPEAPHIPPPQETPYPQETPRQPEPYRQDAYRPETLRRDDRAASVDMEVCSDDEGSRMRKRSGNSEESIPLPEGEQPNGASSLQDRLRSLAGVPATSGFGNRSNGDDAPAMPPFPPTMFNGPPPLLGGPPPGPPPPIRAPPPRGNFRGGRPPFGNGPHTPRMPKFRGMEPGGFDDGSSPHRGGGQRGNWFPPRGGRGRGGGGWRGRGGRW